MLGRSYHVTCRKKVGRFTVWCVCIFACILGSEKYKKKEQISSTRIFISLFFFADAVFFFFLNTTNTTEFFKKRGGLHFVQMKRVRPKKKNDESQRIF